jgi:hypothetical protein
MAGGVTNGEQMTFSLVWSNPISPARPYTSNSINYDNVTSFGSMRQCDFALLDPMTKTNSSQLRQELNDVAEFSRR